MIKNFTVAQGVEICAESKVVDIHNCYAFTKIEFEIIGRNLVLTFLRNDYGVKSGSPTNVLLRFNEVQVFAVSEAFGSSTTTEVEEIGYKPPDDRNLDWLVPEDRRTDKDHIVIRLANDEFIRVFAREAVAIFWPQVVSAS